METQRSIYKITNTPHYDHFVLEIDDNFVKLKHYLFGLFRGEIMRGHDFLAQGFPGYLSLPFEQWAALDTKPIQLEALPQNPNGEPGLQRMIDLLRNRILSQPDNFFHEIHDQLINTEDISAVAIFDPVLGILANDEFGPGEWQTQRFSPAMKDIVSISFEMEEIGVERAAERYLFFEKNFPKHVPAVLSLLCRRFEEMKEETDFGDYVLPEINTDDDMERFVAFTDLKIGLESYMLSGRSNWEQEHGFELSINKEFEITLND